MANKNQTILILNGRRYDALTGAAIADDIAQPAVRPISDMVSGPAVTELVAKSSAAQAPVPVPGPKVMDVSRSVAHTKPRQTQRASTLVRSSVTKPKPGIKAQTKASNPTTAVATPLTTVEPKWPISQVNPTRQNRAGQISKSAAISKFSAGSTVGANSQAEKLAASSVVVQAVDAIEHQPQSSKDLFERAIEAAESHTIQPVTKSSSRQVQKQAKRAAKARKQPVHHHLASVVAASVAVLVIGGVVGMQYKSDITLRFANAKAGFDASLPTYQPDGYSTGAFSYSAGNVGTTFHNDAGNRQYTLNQQTTTWDNQQLLDTYVTPNHSSYQTLQSGDQIIYVYGKNDASWIKDGIWYQLSTNGSLSTSQVLSIASSI